MLRNGGFEAGCSLRCELHVQVITSPSRAPDAALRKFPANRLPVTVQVDDDQVLVSAASGGLATGLRRYHERSSGVWIGWPGVTQDLTILDRRASSPKRGVRRSSLERICQCRLTQGVGMRAG